MKQVVTCQEMKSCDSYTIERMGVPSCVLMERAALKVVEELEKRFTTENIKQIRAQFIWQEIRITGRKKCSGSARLP